MHLALHRLFKILTPAGSLRRRVALSLAIVRLILAPVVFLSVYYLIKMDSILDRVLNVDAPMGTLAQRASIEILQARRAERSYLLLRNPAYLQAHGASLDRAKGVLREMQNLDSHEQAATREVTQEVVLYEQQFAAAVSVMKEPGGNPMQRIQQVVRGYERDLNDVLKRARRDRYPELIEDLRRRIESFDDEIARAVDTSDPTLRQVPVELQTSSQEALRVLSDLEMRSRERVERGHEQARHLVHGAEWVLGIVSGLTLLISIWISFVLPRQVVKPLTDLREAVDHALSGNYKVEFDVRGHGEVVDLAKSVRDLIAQTRTTNLKSPVFRRYDSSRILP
jgi:CHASE3 domain sensor protein